MVAAGAGVRCGLDPAILQVFGDDIGAGSQFEEEIQAVRNRCARRFGAVEAAVLVGVEEDLPILQGQLAGDGDRGVVGSGIGVVTVVVGIVYTGHRCLAGVEAAVIADVVGEPHIPFAVLIEVFPLVTVDVGTFVVAEIDVAGDLAEDHFDGVTAAVGVRVGVGLAPADLRIFGDAVGAGIEAGEGVVAVGVGNLFVEQVAAVVEDLDGPAFKARLAVVELTVTVEIVPLDTVDLGRQRVGKVDILRDLAGGQHELMPGVARCRLLVIALFHFDDGIAAFEHADDFRVGKGIHPGFGRQIDNAVTVEVDIGGDRLGHQLAFGIVQFNSPAVEPGFTCVLDAVAVGVVEFLAMDLDRVGRFEDDVLTATGGQEEPALERRFRCRRARVDEDVVDVLIGGAAEDVVDAVGAAEEIVVGPAFEAVFIDCGGVADPVCQQVVIAPVTEQVVEAGVTDEQVVAGVAVQDVILVGAGGDVFVIEQSDEAGFVDVRILEQVDEHVEEHDLHEVLEAVVAGRRAADHEIVAAVAEEFIARRRRQAAGVDAAAHEVVA